MDSKVINECWCTLAWDQPDQMLDKVPAASLTGKRALDSWFKGVRACASLGKRILKGGEKCRILGSDEAFRVFQTEAWDDLIYAKIHIYTYM